MLMNFIEILVSQGGRLGDSQGGISSARSWEERGFHFARPILSGIVCQTTITDPAVFKRRLKTEPFEKAYCC